MITKHKIIDISKLPDVIIRTTILTREITKMAMQLSSDNVLVFERHDKKAIQQIRTIVLKLKKEDEQYKDIVTRTSYVEGTTPKLFDLFIFHKEGVEKYLKEERETRLTEQKDR